MDAMRNSGRWTRAHTERRLPFWHYLVRAVWYVLGVVLVLLGFRFALLLTGANEAAGFVQFVYALSAPLVAPFQGIFGTPAAGTVVFEPASLLAMAVYAVVAWGIVRLIQLVARPESEVVEHVEEERVDEGSMQRIGRGTDDTRHDHRDIGHPTPV